MSENILLAVAVIALILAIYTAYSNWQLKKALRALTKTQKTLFKGKKAADLEQVLVGLAQKATDNHGNIKNLQQYADQLKEATERSVSRIGIVRFNPFKDTGSNQSFVLALLNDHDNGLVLTSLFTRQGTSIYTKPIRSGQSEFQLTEEEQEAIDKAGEY